MKNLLPKKSKKGITLVETVIAVVVLAILTTGILSLMTAGWRKILLMSKEASDRAAAAQQLDLVIAAVSNGSDQYIKKGPNITDNTVENCYLDLTGLKEAVGLSNNATLRVKFALYDGNIVDTLDDNGVLKTETVNGEETPLSYPTKDIRGWYLELTYKDASAKGVTVEGFVSNSEGVFDQ